MSNTLQKDFFIKQTVSKGKGAGIKFCKLVTIRKSFINTRNRIEVGKGERHNQTNYAKRTNGKKNTTAEAVIGGASPIS